MQVRTAAGWYRPSSISDENGKVLVGNRAKDMLIEKPQNTIFSIKRFMGKGIDDVRDDLPLLPFNVVPDSGEHIVRIKIFGRDYTPPELSAFFLRELKRNAVKRRSAKRL